MPPLPLHSLPPPGEIKNDYTGVGNSATPAQLQSHRAAAAKSAIPGAKCWSARLRVVGASSGSPDQVENISRNVFSSRPVFPMEVIRQ
jgi:hypothetical protein